MCTMLSFLASARTVQCDKQQVIAYPIKVRSILAQKLVEPEINSKIEKWYVTNSENSFQHIKNGLFTSDFLQFLDFNWSCDSAVSELP